MADEPQALVLREPELVPAPAPRDGPLLVKDCQLFFARYPDGVLQLFKRDSLIGDKPAGYSEELVSVRILVKTPTEKFMVVLPTTRRALDMPGAEDYLAMLALTWRH